MPAQVGAVPAQEAGLCPCTAGNRQGRGSWSPVSSRSISAAAAARSSTTRKPLVSLFSSSRPCPVRSRIPVPPNVDAGTTSLRLSPTK